MANDFKVSVIIPVYKAEKYVEEAVLSAVNLKEVGEIILIEDGSPDNAFLICKRLRDTYEKVILLRHDNGQNKGAGASRNLGIRKAKFNFIAFLDADDLYLENRFLMDKEIFEKDNRVGAIFSNTARYYERMNFYYDRRKIERIKHLNRDENLWNFLQGEFPISTNSITIKKSLLEVSGLFNENLKLHQDTHLWLRLMYFGLVVPGNIDEPVSLTRDHENRRIFRKNSKSKQQFLKALVQDFKSYNHVDKRFMKAIINRYLAASGENIINSFCFAVRFLARNPHLIKNYF